MSDIHRVSFSLFSLSSSPPSPFPYLCLICSLHVCTVILSRWYNFIHPKQQILSLSFGMKPEILYMWHDKPEIMQHGLHIWLPVVTRLLPKPFLMHIASVAVPKAALSETGKLCLPWSSSSAPSMDICCLSLGYFCVPTEILWGAAELFQNMEEWSF